MARSRVQVPPRRDMPCSSVGLEHVYIPIFTNLSITPFRSRPSYNGYLSCRQIPVIHNPVWIPNLVSPKTFDYQTSAGSNPVVPYLWRVTERPKVSDINPTSIVTKPVLPTPLNLAQAQDSSIIFSYKTNVGSNPTAVGLSGSIIQRPSIVTRESPTCLCHHILVQAHCGRLSNWLMRVQAPSALSYLKVVNAAIGSLPIATSLSEHLTYVGPRTSVIIWRIDRSPQPTCLRILLIPRPSSRELSSCGE